MLPTLPIGTYLITAHPDGDGITHGPPGTAIHTVTRPSAPGIATTTTLASDNLQSKVGETATFTARVEADTGSGTPTGTVVFSLNGGAVQTVAVDSQGVARFTTSPLLAGEHLVSAAFSGDLEFEASTSGTMTQSVGRFNTQITLVAERNPSEIGGVVRFTATVTAPNGETIDEGLVSFFIDGVEQPPITISAWSRAAVFVTRDLDAGEHEVVARFHGDELYASALSDPIIHRVVGDGSVTIRVESDGADTTFNFTSATTELNLSVATSGGRGESAPIELDEGTYSLTASDIRSEGLSLTSIACTDGTGDLETRTATIQVAIGQAVTCTFVARDARSHTTDMIGEFMLTRAGLILSHQTDMQRRIDRLNGTVQGMGNPVSALTSYLPGIVDGGTLSMSGSLAQVDRLAGNAKPGRFDIWGSLTHGRYVSDGFDGRFTIGAVGADYLVSRDLLIGGFFQVDRLSQDHDISGASVSGTGWLAGPYLTTRLSEHLFFDVLAAAGRSDNSISPFGTYEDDFGATRFMASAALQGNWTAGPWTFSPRARLGWFREKSDSYNDSLGILIPSVTAERGQFSFGPGVAYLFETPDGVAVSAGLRVDAVIDYTNTSTRTRENGLHGRLEGTVGLAFPGGARVDLSASHDGIGRSRSSSTSGKVAVSLPLN